MNRQITTVIGLTAAILSLSACNVVDVAHYNPSVVVTDVRPGAGHGDIEGRVALAPAPCEGSACPTPPPVFYPCVSGTPEGAITEGAGSHICP